MKKMSVRKKLTLFTMVAFVVPLCIWFVFSISQMRARVFEAKIANAGNVLSQMRLHMTGVIDDCQVSVRQISSNYDIQELLRSENHERDVVDSYKRKLSAFQYTILTQNSAIQEMYVLHENETIFDIYNLFYRADDIEDYLKRLYGGNVNDVTHAVYRNRSGTGRFSNASEDQCHWCVCNVVWGHLASQPYGIAEIIIRDEALYAMMADYAAPEGESLCMMLASGEIVWGELPEGIALDPAEIAQDGGNPLSRGGITVVSRAIPQMDAVLVYAIADSALALSRGEMGVLLLVTACCVLSMLVMVSLISGAVFKRLTNLSARMDSVSSQFSRSERVLGGRDELDVLEDCFDRMLKRIDEAGEAEKRLLFDDLTNELKPHFICNAMDMLQLQAERCHQAELADSIRQIGQYFRYSMMREKKGVSLLTELDDARNYIELINTMRENRILLEIRLDEWSECHAADLIIPKMIIQPLLDNAVHHGLKYAEAGLIMIRLKRAGPDLHIEVEDNGAGMTPERQAMLREAMAGNAQWADERRHVGVTNVMMRMEVFYSGGYTLDFVSSPEGGTVFTLTLKGVD